MFQVQLPSTVMKFYYNGACTALMALSKFIIINNELMKKYPDLVPEQSPLIILDSKSDVCMSKNGKETKHTRHITRRINVDRNGEY